MAKYQSRQAWITIAAFEFYENIRNKWLLIYGLSFLLFSGFITYIGTANPLQASASLLNLVLLLVPLFSLVFGSISFSESLSFHNVLVALPVSRRAIYIGKWIGLSSGLSVSFLIGMGMGSLIQFNVADIGFAEYALLMGLGIMLTLIFLSLSFYIAVVIGRRELIFGWMLLLWFFFFIFYDVAVIGMVLVFGDYPLEMPMLALVLSNPIDLSRVLFLSRLDLSAMMGYAGAVFQIYLGHSAGLFIGGFSLFLWMMIPLWLGMRRFEKKDL